MTWIVWGTHDPQDSNSVDTVRMAEVERTGGVSCVLGISLKGTKITMLCVFSVTFRNLRNRDLSQNRREGNTIFESTGKTSGNSPRCQAAWLLVGSTSLPPQTLRLAAGVSQNCHRSDFGHFPSAFWSHGNFPTRIALCYWFPLG